MTDFDNGAFMEQLNPDYHSKKKDNLTTYLVIGFIISTASAFHFYVKTKEYQEEIAKGHLINNIG
jgi:hypothetical protein